MRKLMKFCLIAGGICIVAGGGIAVSARVMGAEWSGMYYNDMGYFDRWRRTLTKLEHLPGIRELDEDSGDWEEGYTYSGVRELKLDIEAGGVELIEDGEGEEIRVVCSPGIEKYLDIGMEGKELKIKTSFSPGWFGLDGDNSKKRLVYIYVPTDYYFDEVKLEVGAGGIDAGALNAGEAKLKAKAGGIEVRNGNVGELEAKCAAGGVEYAGRVDGDIDAECSAGGISLFLEGIQTDYNYELKCQMGSIEIQGSSYSALSGKKEIDNGAARKMELECQTGGIEVVFDESL